MTLEYKLNDEEVVLDLNLNQNLLPKEHYVSYQLPNGSMATLNFTKETVDLCHFHGRIRNKPNTFAALSTCGSNIRGIVNDDDETYYIENDEVGRQHYVYRHTESKRYSRPSMQLHLSSRVSFYLYLSV